MIQYTCGHDRTSFLNPIFQTSDSSSCPPLFVKSTLPCEEPHNAISILSVKGLMAPLPSLSVPRPIFRRMQAATQNVLSRWVRAFLYSHPSRHPSACQDAPRRRADSFTQKVRECANGNSGTVEEVPCLANHYVVYSFDPSTDKHAGGWSNDELLPEYRYLNVVGGFLGGFVEYTSMGSLFSFFDITARAEESLMKMGSEVISKCEFMWSNFS